MLIRNGGFFFLSLINTACITVFPQYFFANHPHEARSIWLSATLFLGAVLSLAGVQIAKRTGIKDGSFFKAFLVCGWVVFFSLASGSDWISSPLLFLVIQCATCFGVNFLGQELDVRSVMIAGTEGRNRNDLLITALRFFGMLSGPLVFSFAMPGTASAISVLFVGSVLVCISTGLLMGPISSDMETDSSLQIPPEPLHERIIEVLSLSIYGCYCVLAASTVYLLSDLQNLQDAATRGLQLISVVYASAFLGTLAISLLKKKAKLSWLLYAPLSLFLAAFFIRREQGHSWGYQLLACFTLGIGFALFLIAYRDRLSHRALTERNSGLIAKYNSLPRISALIGFLLMLAISALDSFLHRGFAISITAFLMSFSAVLFAGVLWLVSYNAHDQAILALPPD
jgi:hypothetical protein